MEYFNRYSPEYIEALKTGNGRYKIRLEILSDNESVIGDITKDVSLSAQGQITINYEQITRRSCSLTLINVDNKYVPHKNSPFWLNRKFKLWLGLVVLDDIYWWSEGIFYTLSATAVNNTLSIEGVDKGAALDGTLKLNMTDVEYLIERGDSLGETVKQMLALDVGASNIINSSGLIYGGNYPVDSTNPLIAIQYYKQPIYSQIIVDANNYIGEVFTKLAELYGADCYYDTEGHFVFTPYIESSGYNYTPRQWDFDDLSSYYEDANYNYSYDGENVVTYYTNSSEAGIVNVAWTAYNTNPLSPLNISTGIRRAQAQEIPYYEYYGDGELAEYAQDLAEIQQEITDKGIDVTRTVYGNIDTNDRQLLYWTDENLERFAEALASWDLDAAEYAGSVSTIIGMSNEYGGVEIAYSPMLQTVDGAVLLTAEIVDEYIDTLVNSLTGDWTTEQLLTLDVTGLTIDGTFVNKLIADAGETAILTGEAMHYVGQYGALAQAQNAYDNAEKEKDELNKQQMIQDCRAAANHYLIKNSLIGMQISFNCPIIPHMDVNKTIGITDRTVDIEDGIFIVQSVTIPLSANKMSISATNINWLPNDAMFEGVCETIEPEIEYEETTENDYIYITDTNSSQTIKYTGTAVNIKMPKTLDNKSLTVIGYGTFYEQNVQRVIIPDGVTTIE